jgi:lipid II:glycine glycyltransferase (peptidoglycan interpeptide bridge formation enzyme)
MSIRVFPSDQGADRAQSFLQSRFWGDFKAEFGWKPLSFELEVDSAQSSLLVLIRRMPAGFSFAYIPHGPELDLAEAERSSSLARIAEALRPFLPKTCLFIRFDPQWYEVEAPRGEGEEAALAPKRPGLGSPLRRAAADVQPPDTVLVDLGPSEELILAAMKPKWRYNIRLAEKKGVVVEEAGAEAIPVFYELYRATSERDKIALHPERYYRRLFELASERRAAEKLASSAGAPDIRLWVARHEGRALAAIITLFRGGRAVYLYGASSDEERNLMPTYALQWAAMRAAKAASCLEYDLFGIPPTDDPEHPMAGLYRFKTGFGGKLIHRAGSWDYALSGPIYGLFRLAEKARTWWFKDFKKRLKKGIKKKDNRDKQD